MKHGEREIKYEADIQTICYINFDETQKLSFNQRSYDMTLFVWVSVVLIWFVIFLFIICFILWSNKAKDDTVLQDDRLFGKNKNYFGEHFKLNDEI